MYYFINRILVFTPLILVPKNVLITQSDGFSEYSFSHYHPYGNVVPLIKCQPQHHYGAIYDNTILISLIFPTPEYLILLKNITSTSIP